MTRKKRYSEQNVKSAVENALTIKQALKNMGLRAAGGNYKVFHKYVKQYGIDTSHFEAEAERTRALKAEAMKKKIPLVEILVENSTYNRGHLKERLYNEGLKERKCETPGCGQGEEWMGKKISLIMDHINGVHDDNRLQNLQIVCPNCAAALETHCRGVVELKVDELQNQRHANGGRTDAEIKASKARRVTERPPLKKLKQEIEEYGYSATGRKYGVSDNAIRKWLKQ